MAVAVLLTAAVMIGESVLCIASPTPQPTYPRWDTKTPAAPSAVPTQEAVELEGDHDGKALDRATSDHSRKTGSSIVGADIAAVDSVVLRQDYEDQPATAHSLASDTIFTDRRAPTIPTHHGREWWRAGAGRLRLSMIPEKSLAEKDAAVGRDVSPRASHAHKHPLPVSRPPPPRVINLSAVRARLATLSTAGLGAVRGVRLIFMLMQYLGFLPHVPGLPKYDDPAKVKPSIHYSLPRGDAGLL